MQLSFYKFQANGNDFVLIDNREGTFSATPQEVARLCHRRWGIGADGLLLLNRSEKYDFEMHYFNADGNPAEMCGNGGRSIAALAFFKGIAGKEMQFRAADGVHEARVESMDAAGRIFDISLKMQEVQTFRPVDEGWFVNTGVPHWVRFVANGANVDVQKTGRKLRNDARFSPDGTNVDFVEVQNDRLFVRTYERGVEAETLSCGTGVTASVLAAFLKTGKKFPLVHTCGGDFQVRFQKTESGFCDVWLRGPVERVFEGLFFI
jgi:diaminopimelate epimerase